MLLSPVNIDSLLSQLESGLIQEIINENHMDTDDWEKEKALLKRLENRDIKAFKQFYKKYSGDLLILGYCLLENSGLAIQLVDDLFERLWIEESFGQIDPPIHKFLYTEFKKGL